jgi:putative transposase
MLYRRAKNQGGSYFITIVTFNRHFTLAAPQQVDLLRRAFRDTLQRHPFKLDAIAVMPDHFHCILTLPRDDADYPLRVRLIKSSFTRNYKGQGGNVSASRVSKGERAVWQRRYWEHMITDEDDFIKHVEYIHYNPVKHGLVQAPRDWQWSSFQDYVKKGYYDLGWGADVPIEFSDGLVTE